MNPLYIAASIAFVLIVFSLVYGIVRLVRATQSWRLLPVIIPLWLMTTAYLASTGFLSDWEAFPPHLLFVVLPALAVVPLLAFGRPTHAWLSHASIPALVLFQTFRVLLEVSLWALYAASIVPRAMTFEGWNFDIVPALLAPLIAYIYTRHRNRWVVVAWNILGLVTIATVVTISALSTPVSFRVFFTDPPNTIIATFPWIWLPTFVVPVAILGHILSLRQMFMSRIPRAKPLV